MSCDLFLLDDDEEPTRQDWHCRDVMSSDSKIIVKHFELHKLLWRLKTGEGSLNTSIIITCMSNCAETWEVRVGIVDETAKEIAASDAIETHDKNVFKVYDLYVSQIPLAKNWRKKFRFFVDVKRKEDEVMKMRKTCIRELQSDYENLLFKGGNRDITLLFKGQKFYCHRCILTARSPVFASMMESASHIMFIEDIDPIVFKDFLLFLYSGSIKHIKQENIPKIYNLADKYLLEHLKDPCIKIVPCSQIHSGYEELLSSGKWSDVIIKVKGRIFNCHKCILTARSEVFAAMLKHNFKEKITGMVTIEDAESTIFQEFLFYLYTGCGERITSENVTELYNLADKYLVEHLKELCMRIKEKILIDNFFSEISQQLNNSKLSDEILQFFFCNAKMICRSEKWKTLFKENFTICAKLLFYKS